MSGKDKGVTFKVRLRIEAKTVAVGPNPVLPDQKLPNLQPSKLEPKVELTNVTGKDITNSSQEEVLGSGDRLFNLIQGAYSALNTTQPNMTEDCWLCLVANPPYYEGIAILGN